MGMYCHMMYAEVTTSVVAWHTEHMRFENATRVDGPLLTRLLESSLGEKGPKYAHAKMHQYARKNVAIHCAAVSPLGGSISTVLQCLLAGAARPHPVDFDSNTVVIAFHRSFAGVRTGRGRAR